MAKINGTTASETLRGTALGDTIFGLAGNDTIFGGGASDLLAGGVGNDKLYGEAGDDSLHGDVGADRIDGGLGNDWVLYFDGATAGVQVFLYQNRATGGAAAGDTLFDIENVQATKFADTIHGNAQANFLDGRDGNDKLYGREGNDNLAGGSGGDLLDGGVGIDWALYLEGAKTGVVVSLFNNANALGASGDVLVAIENVQGTNFADTITGGSGDNFLLGLGGADKLYGREGSDELQGGAGGDRLDGGAGIDWALYAEGATGAVVVSLFNNANAGGASGDTIFDIENVQGTAFADSITGNTAANYLVGLAGADKLYGREGNDNLEGGAGGDRLDGGAGVDWALYSSSTTAILLSMFNNANAGGASGDTLFDVENVQGTALADSITGNSADNYLMGLAGADKLYGREGNDNLEGGLGADRLDGGSGLDWALYAASTSGVIVSLYNNANFGGASGDTLFDIENILGSAFADTLTGNSVANFLQGGAGNDKLNGREGDDNLEGGEGADTIDGGIGNDWALYSSSKQAVTVSLASNAGNARGALGDILTSIENVLGSSFADLITGNALNNAIEGGSGDDTIRGGGGTDQINGGLGKDVLDGGEGVDWLSYSNAGSGVTVNLSTNTVGGAAFGDQISNFELLIGSQFADTLTGSSIDNVIEGRAGDDRLFGLGGADRLDGGLGADTIDGGEGIDRLVFSGAASAVIVDLAVAANNGGWAAGDVYSNIENVEGTQFADAITGDAQTNLLIGLEGNDTLKGGAGHDTLIGGAGNDTLTDDEAANVADDDVFAPGTGNDLVTGDGNDSIDYSEFTVTVTVDLSVTGALQTGGGADGDTLVGILSVTGGSAGDTLTSSVTGHGADIATIRGLGGNDTIILNHASDIALGGDGNDTITMKAATQIAQGGIGNDTFFLEATGQQAFGGDDADTINLKSTGQRGDGGAGNDTLIATGATDASLFGGLGSDTLTGSATQRDYFVLELNKGADSITNFLSANGDRLAIDDVVYGFASTRPTTNQVLNADEFLVLNGGVISGTGTTHQFIFDTLSKGVFYDDDGAGAHAAVLLATLDASVTSLSRLDFLIF